MSSPLRILEEGAFYHVYNRGNRKQEIFLNDRDYERFLKKIIEYKVRNPVKILAYCLMPNHFHFILQQLTSNSISRFISDLCNSHSKYFNIKHETVGSLFQGRFKAKKVEKDEYLIHLSRYIHLNPLDLFNFSSLAFLNQVLDYKWSSLPLYLSKTKNEIVDPTFILNYFSKKDTNEDYKKFIFSDVEVKNYSLIENLLLD